MEDCGGGQEMDDWLEEQIQARFPDDLNIPPGQLRVRIFKLVQEYEQRMLGTYKETPVTPIKYQGLYSRSDID